MNKTEARYELEVLLPASACGTIPWYAYEGMSLKLGPDLRYTPDFIVQKANGDVECHDVKPRVNVKDEGGNVMASKPLVEDAGRVKMISAAEKFPFRFSAHWFDRSAKVWQEKVY